MNWPYQFPHPADVIAEEAERNRHLSISDRLDRMMDLYAAGRELADQTAWDRHQRLKEGAETEWRTAHLQVFKRHGR